MDNEEDELKPYVDYAVPIDPETENRPITKWDFVKRMQETWQPAFKEVHDYYQEYRHEMGQKAGHQGKWGT